MSKTVSSSVTSSPPFQIRSLCLSGKQWIVVALLATTVFIGVPAAWRVFESFEPDANYRIPHEESNNYWMIHRWLKRASEEYPVLVLGDSTAWGHYAPRDETLAQQLNRTLGSEVAVNAGVDGMHPVALHGLVRYYGRSLRNKRILIYLNLLWMSSERHDLRSSEEARFNHPRLVPQVYPRIPAYRPDFPEIVSVTGERYLPFMRWSRHLRHVYFENMSLPDWTLMYPYTPVWEPVDFSVPEPRPGPRSRAVPWTEARIASDQDLPWMSSDESLQWSYFLRTIDLLRRRGNEVFVLLGPFNTHLLSDESAARFDVLHLGVLRDLDGRGIAHLASSPLPSDEFGDGSHPLAAGYARMAREMAANPTARDWLDATMWHAVRPIQPDEQPPVQTALSMTGSHTAGGFARAGKESPLR